MNGPYQGQIDSSSCHVARTLPLALFDVQGWARTDSDRAAETMRAVDVQATSVPASASSLLILIQMHVFVDSADVFAVRLGEMKSKRRGSPPARLVV